VQVRGRGRAAGSTNDFRGVNVALTSSQASSSHAVCSGHHPQALALAAVRHRDVGPDVEQVVLDPAQEPADALGRSGSVSSSPIWALSSSTVPYASIRGCVFGTRLMSPRCVSPSSPRRV
jgi:hypothetical protein